MLAAGGSAGALCAAPTSDTVGRKWSVFLWGVIFVVGAAMQMIADYKVLLAGRFIAGMGVGASSMLTPQFLAENSPKSIRGSMTATYNLMILFSLMLAFWVNYGVSKWSAPANEESRQWRVSMGIQLIPGALMVLMIPFVPETPVSNDLSLSSRFNLLTQITEIFGQPRKSRTRSEELDQTSRSPSRTPIHSDRVRRDPSSSTIRTRMFFRSQLLGCPQGYLHHPQQFSTILPRRHVVPLPQVHWN